MIRLENVRFYYGDLAMCFDLEVPRGEMAVVFGPSGAGKSTLLNLIAGFEEPAGGRIALDGRDVGNLPPARRPVTSLFQDHNLFAHLSAARNVGLGIHPGLKLAASDHKRIEQALASVGLAGYSDRFPGTLSGGERQRIALARSLVSARPILLLDEPFAALGPAQRRELADLVHRLHEERELTVLMVSHMPDEAGHLPVRGLFLADGRIHADGPITTLLAPDAPPVVRAYLGTGAGPGPEP
ncbi:thiamine ABC transporter ATP-binding protein [Fodinicurvata sp. EGI_FJ10296]|uniref:thiamine ABC transporter ATP-binding protein n=1 Tax=Fodinicurvata sp. EGI_FJ10296 TaxID=3231908 RepID=UPI0034529045